MIIDDLRRDKRVLQDEHNRLLQTVFGENQNKEVQFDRERSLYRAKVQQLEQTMSSSIPVLVYRDMLVQVEFAAMFYLDSAQMLQKTKN